MSRISTKPKLAATSIAPNTDRSRMLRTEMSFFSSSASSCARSDYYYWFPCPQVCVIESGSRWKRLERCCLLLVRDLRRLVVSLFGRRRIHGFARLRRPNPYQPAIQRPPQACHANSLRGKHFAGSAIRILSARPAAAAAAINLLSRSSSLEAAGSISADE